MNAIDTSIKTIASATGIDARYILAIMLQESGGCVRVHTTNWGVRNPGLMQDHNGDASCNEGGIQDPCPDATIHQMIVDGVMGTRFGDGLQQLLKKAGGGGHVQYFRAARMYNSGSLHPSGDLGAGIATHCYVSDVANRLTGWVRAASTCSLDGAPVSNAAPEPADVEQPIFKPMAVAPAPLPAAVPLAQPALAPPAPAQPAAPAQPIAAANVQSGTMDTSLIKAHASNPAPGVTSNCKGYYRVREGDYCDKVAIATGTTFAKMRMLNTQLDAKCSNLWREYDYCVVE
jgi:hypothetical protein